SINMATHPRPTGRPSFSSPPNISNNNRGTIIMLNRTLCAALFLSTTALTASAQVKPVLPSDSAARPRTPEAQATLDASTQELMREMKLLGINQLRQPKEA